MNEIFTKLEVSNIAEQIEAQLQDNREGINEAFQNMQEFNATISLKAVPVRNQIEVSIQTSWTKGKFKIKNTMAFNPGQLPMFPATGG